MKAYAIEVERPDSGEITVSLRPGKYRMTIEAADDATNAETAGVVCPPGVTIQRTPAIARADGGLDAAPSNYDLAGC